MFEKSENLNTKIRKALNLQKEKVASTNIENKRIEDEEEIDVTDTQRRITEFITNFHKNTDPQPQVPTEIENGSSNDDEETSLSTQIMIEDARERRARGTKFIQCENCNYKTSSNYILQEHIRVEHKAIETEYEEVNNSPTVTIRERFQCEECQFKTTAKDVLEKHMKINHQKRAAKNNTRKRINCKQCPKYFYLEKTFKAHMRQIHGDQGYPCEKSFENNDMLRTHIETIHEPYNILSIQQGEVPDGSR